jgi:hypothetical protein
MDLPRRGSMIATSDEAPTPETQFGIQGEGGCCRDQE